VRRKLFGNAVNAKENFNLMVQSFNYFDLDENGLISFDELA
jgi:Ca2+-binding EF-hand superfamily protein